MDLPSTETLSECIESSRTGQPERCLICTYDRQIELQLRYRGCETFRNSFAPKTQKCPGFKCGVSEGHKIIRQ